MWIRKSYKLTEVCIECGIQEERAMLFIQNEWISPADPQELLLDEEDIARIRLITHLQEEFGVNDEAVPIILHLIDQLHCIQSKGNK